MSIDKPRRPTRDQISRWAGNDQRLIRSVEELFDVVPGDLNTLLEQIEGVSYSADSASARATAAFALIQKIRDQEGLTPPPRPQSVLMDYAQFSSHPVYAKTHRRIGWDHDDDTLNICHSGGVVQQVGSELYARAANSSGSPILNGQTVGLTGVGTDIGRYIADGSLPTQYFIGVATQDIPVGSVGRITVWGLVREIDTSLFSVGDILYASPTIQGGLTNIKPTTPDHSIPVGICAVSGVLGEVFVAPIKEQQMYYGAFSASVSQTPAVINTAYAIPFNTIEQSSGVSIGSPTSRIVAANSGLYSVNSSVHISSNSASVKNIWTWFRLNGADVPNSGRKVSVDSGTAVITVSRAEFYPFAPGDYIELMYAADSTNVTIEAFGATAFGPASPAATIRLEQIQQ